jgi:hypothetical protein
VLDLSADVELREWAERLALADHAIEAVPQDRDLARETELRRLREELGGLRRLLAEKEAELGRLAEVEVRMKEAQAALGDYAASSEMANSLSWKLTRPLRLLIRIFQKLRS